ncbi:MAG: replicative DNA helicase [Pseudomonadota bacterium]
MSLIPEELGEISRLRTPPHSLEAEQSLLGGLMLDGTAWDRVADVVAAEDFYRQDHAKIFAACATLIDKRVELDAVTLSQHLDSLGQLSEVGGLDYLSALSSETPNAANVRAYAKIVRERSLLRSLVSVGNEIAGSVFNTDGNGATELVEKAEQAIFQIAETGQAAGAGLRPIQELLPGVVDEIDRRYKRGGEPVGISTGFKDFDALTTGLQASDLIIVAGRPSMGKTTFAVNIAENAALGVGKVPTAIYSMEMSAEQLMFRMMSSLGQVTLPKLRTGKLADQDWARINSAVQLLGEAPVFIDDTPGLTPTELRARARRLKRQHDLGLIVVDYLQLMEVPGGNAENRATEISTISRSLKALAKEINVPVIALSQLNRAVDSRQDKRPVMSDLRESGAIEQDADLIVFIYREQVYDPNTPRKNVADIILGKHRNGPTGDIQLTFQGEFTRFRNYIPEIPVYDDAPPSF